MAASTALDALTDDATQAAGNFAVPSSVRRMYRRSEEAGLGQMDVDMMLDIAGLRAYQPGGGRGQGIPGIPGVR